MTESMKILFLATESILKIGGAGYVERVFVKALKELGYHVVVVLPTLHVPSLLTYLGLKLYLQANLQVKAIEEVLDRERIDVIISMGILNKALAKFKNKIKIIVYYNMLTPWEYEIRGYYRKYSWRNLSMLYFAWRTCLNRSLTCDFNPFTIADYVAVNSEYMRLLAIRYWNKDVYVLSPPVFIEKYQKFVKNLSERGDYIICFGRISPEKRYEVAIKALSFSALKPRLKLLIAGALDYNDHSKIMYLRSLLNLAKRYGVKLEVKLNVDERTKIELLSRALAYIHTAIGEHFGITVVEAMATGTPVIVHSSGEPYFGITQQGLYGLIFKDSRDLAKKIDTLISDQMLWNRYHIKGLNRSMHYDYSKFVKNLEELLQQKLWQTQNGVNDVKHPQHVP